MIIRLPTYPSFHTPAARISFGQESTDVQGIYAACFPTDTRTTQSYCGYPSPSAFRRCTEPYHDNNSLTHPTSSSSSRTLKHHGAAKKERKERKKSRCGDPLTRMDRGEKRAAALTAYFWLLPSGTSHRHVPDLSFSYLSSVVRLPPATSSQIDARRGGQPRL